MRAIGLANALTLSRFALAPVFAAVFGATVLWPSFAIAGITLLFVLFLVIELTDVLDGAVARRRDDVSDLGKILDPFADVVSKVTYFTCLVSVGVVPLWFLLIVLYREFGIILIRMILYRDGTALAARRAGKIKTWFYALTAAFGLFLFATGTLGAAAASWHPIVMLGLLVVTSALSIYSFVTYLVGFLRLRPSS